jgi:hypothetical protein
MKMDKFHKWILRAMLMAILALLVFAGIEINKLGFNFLAMLAVGLAYFIPSFIAGIRKHRKSGTICALNLLLGWTGIGWVIALIWALVGKTE